jgi:hypothetical protein
MPKSGNANGLTASSGAGSGNGCSARLIAYYFRLLLAFNASNGNYAPNFYSCNIDYAKIITPHIMAVLW